MTKDELKELLNAQTNEQFVDRELLGREPWIFGNLSAEYTIWRKSIAAILSVQADSILIVGSAAMGYSLSPLKPARIFRRPGTAAAASDVDVALVDEKLFKEAWNTILIFDRGRSLRISLEERTKTRVDVYWGVVAQRSLPANTRDIY
jgi:hypothetical protein